MSTHAAGEGGNPLQRGVGSPIHTPTLGGGDGHTFIPFTSPFPLHAPLSSPRDSRHLISFELKWSNGCVRGQLALLNVNDTWLCPAVKIFIKMKSGRSGSVTRGQTTGKAQRKQTVCS